MPLCTVLLVQCQHLVLFLWAELLMLYGWVDRVHPSLSALSWLPLTAGVHTLVVFSSDGSPLVWLVSGCAMGCVSLREFLGYFLQNLGLLRRPCVLVSLHVLDEEPSLLALEGASTRDKSGDNLPVVLGEGFDWVVVLVCQREDDVLE